VKPLGRMPPVTKAQEPRIDPVPPPAVPEPGWKPFERWKSVGPGRPFLSEEPLPSRVRVRHYQREADGAIVGRAWFGPGAQGPPGCAHGGSIAAVLDEAMGASCWRAGHKVVAARLVTEYRQMLPLGTDATIEAWIDAVEGRKVRARSRLLAADGAVYAEAEGLFVQLRGEQLRAIEERLRAMDEEAGRWSGPGA
jgi:acyl-coenzyme A thioesterase PaaI-like protein